MTERNMKLALEEAKRVVGMIEADELTEEQKAAVIKDSIANFNENYNPGWLDTENQYQLTPHSLNGATAVKTVHYS